MDHTYLRYECADWFGLSVASASSRAPVSSAMMVTLGKNTNLVLTIAGSGITVQSMQSGQIVAKLAHRDASPMGTGRALNSDEIVCLDVASVDENSSSGSDPQYKIATGWVDGAVRIQEISLNDILEQGKRPHSLLDDDDDQYQSQSEPPLLLNGHATAVRTVQFDLGGIRLASGGSDGAVVVWDVVAETGLFRLLGHRGPVTDLSFVSVVGMDALISCSLDGLVKVWDLPGQCCTQTVAAHSPLAAVCRGVGGGADESDGDTPQQKRWRLLTGGKDGRVRVWSVEPSARSSGSADAAATTTSATKAIVAMQVGEGGEKEITAGASENIDNTNNTNPDDVCHYMGTLLPPPNVATSNEKIACLHYDATGRFVGVLHANAKHVDVYRVRSYRETLKKRTRRLRRRQEKQAKRQTQAGNDPTGGDATAATSSGKKRGILDDPESSDEELTNDNEADGDQDVTLDPERVKASDEWEYLATVRATHKLRGFSFLPKAKSDEIIRLVGALATNALETHALMRPKVGNGRTSIVVSQLLATMDFHGHPTGVRSVALSSDDRLACTVSKSVTKVWNVASRTCIQSLSPAVAATGKKGKKSKATPCYGLCTAFLPGNMHIVVGTREGHLLLIDISAGEVVYVEHQAHDGAVWGLDVRRPSADDSSVVVVTGSADKCVKFWSIEAQEEDDDYDDENEGAAGGEGQPMLVHTRTLQLSDDVIAVGYSKTVDPTKRLVFVSTLDSTIKVFFDDSLKLFLSLYGHKLPALAVDASDDDVLLASSGADKAIKIWGLDFGDTHRTLHGHDDSITDLKFVRRTHNFFTASKDGSVRYWDGDRFEQILLLNGHCAEVNCLAISRTGAFVLSGSMDRQVRVWERTKDIVFLEEERERELEQIFDRVSQHDEGSTAQILDRKRGEDDDSDTEVVKDEDPQSEAAVRRSVLSISAGDRVMEALERADQEMKEIALFLRAHGSDKKRPPNLLMLGLEPAPYILWVLRTIKSAELEMSLIVLSLRHIERLMYYLIVLLKTGSGVELCSRVAIFLVKAHQNQIIATSTMAPPLRELRRLVRMRLAESRDMIGFDLAALKLISKAANERKQSFVGGDEFAKDIWADLGLGSDVAAALEGRSKRR